MYVTIKSNAIFCVKLSVSELNCEGNYVTRRWKTRRLNRAPIHFEEVNVFELKNFLVNIQFNLI
jgi:hypothetical protein